MDWKTAQTREPEDEVQANSAPALLRGSETAAAAGDMATAANTAEADAQASPEEEAVLRPSLARRALQLYRFIFFSSLTRRIVFLNLAALAVLLSGILYLNQFREGLTDARVESLLIQGRIIAGAIAASATVETNAITVDPEKLIELQAGETSRPSARSFETLDPPIQAERVAPILRSLIQPTRTRGRIYDQDGILLLDSRYLYSGGQILRFDLPPLSANQEGMIARIGKTLNRWLQRRDLPVYKEVAGTDYPEVMSALTGGPSTVVRMTEQGEMIVSVAVPIQRFRAVLGALLLSTQGGDIDRIVAEERIAILRMFLVVGIVILILSILMAGTIANPLSKLAEAAVRVRYGVKSRVEIPDMSARGDEIGNLSQSLRDMTNALYARIEAIESFAADVSHELKNPLTSLRSAVETLPIASNDLSRKKLMAVIQHDVRRLDRLITDISDASRLDAELAREDSGPVDLRGLLENFVTLQRTIEENKQNVAIGLKVDPANRGSAPFRINGHEIRIGQVIANLMENARSFVPQQDGHIDLTLRRSGRWIEIVVVDNGPGIQAEKIESIFERFYTDRPEERFGQNSGLGLSISRQIIAAHGGTLTAKNRKAPEHGAQFTVRLPSR